MFDPYAPKEMPRTGETCASLNESQFRRAVRDALDLSWDARDEKIIEEIRKLKAARNALFNKS